MKHTAAILFFIIIGLNVHSQTGTIRGKQFQLTGKIKDSIQMTAECGIFAWGTVIEFEVVKLVGLTYSGKSIGVIVTCPEGYGENFFQKGKTYQVIFSDKNQANFGWLVPNRDLLVRNALSFEPYAVSIKEVQEIR